VLKRISSLRWALTSAVQWIKWQLSGRTEPEVVRAVRDDALTYLSRDALTDLHDRVCEAEERSVEGVLIEAGCALGGSAIVMAAAKAPDRPLFVYDVFGMIPPPSERDGADVHERYEVIRSGQSTGIKGATYYGYEENLLEQVQDNFARHGYPPAEHSVSLVQGLFHDTIRPDGPVAVAHIDGDWYDSVMTCLERIEPHLSVGGVLVIDDYDAWSGCRTAVDEYFADKQDRYAFETRARLHILRVR
jgi:asparagine synthase (glutamine-hydrolysing)